MLVHVPDGERVRIQLRADGIAVRRCDTFPGLSSDWLRIAVRDDATNERIIAALRQRLPVPALSSLSLPTV